MANKQKKVTDVSINAEYGVPIRTIQDWKNSDPDSWRFKTYQLFRTTIKNKNAEAEKAIEERDAQSVL